MFVRMFCSALVLAVALLGFGEAFAESDESPNAEEGEWTLERLLTLGQTEIIELWKQCPPATLEDMNGLFLGLIPNADDPVLKKRIDNVMFNESSSRGYWVGKAYKQTSKTEGEGYNRWRHPGGKFTHGQRFATEMGTSLVDGKPALMMYYETYNPGMPLIDEVRKLGDNLYVGIGTTPQPDGSRKLFGHFAYIGPVHEWVEFDGRTASAELEMPAGDAQEAFGGKHIMLLMDANGDGTIAREEAPEQLAQSFAIVDADGSGGIDEKEAEMVAAFLSGQYGQDLAPEAILSKMIIDNYDTDNDDKLTREEAGDEVGANFDQIDANQDGMIDDQEGLAMVEALKSRNRDGGR